MRGLNLEVQYYIFQSTERKCGSNQVVTNTKWQYVFSPLCSRCDRDFPTAWESVKEKNRCGTIYLTAIVLLRPLFLTPNQFLHSHQTVGSMWNPVGNSFTQSMFSIISYRQTSSQPMVGGKTLTRWNSPLLSYSRFLLSDCSIGQRVVILFLARRPSSVLTGQWREFHCLQAAITTGEHPPILDTFSGSSAFKPPMPQSHIRWL